MLTLNLNAIESAVILRWFEHMRADSQHFGNGLATFPQEQAVVKKLQDHQTGPIEFSEPQVDLIADWMDGALRSAYGESIFATPEERSVFEKISRYRP